ncbi:MAG: hypothetical protein NTV22_16290 [bacterium]|nr:hypothetical protein [bacterium]
MIWKFWKKKEWLQEILPAINGEKSRASSDRLQFSSDVADALIDAFKKSGIKP